MALTIYSYFNVAQVATLMDSVAAITSSSDFLGALRVVAIIGFMAFVAGIALGKNTDPFEFFRWVLVVALINVVLIVPKFDVVIVDRTTNQPPTVRSNVPMGLAVFAAVSSQVGDYMTRAFENVFAQPDDIAFQKSGVMFGNTVVSESLRTAPESPTFKLDLTEFINSCTYYDILEGRISQEALVSTADIWPLLKNTSQARLTKLSTAPSGSAPCDQAYSSIGLRLPGEIAATLKVRGRILNPAAPSNEVASATYQAQLTSSYSYLTTISKSATDIMRQSMMLASMRDSQMISAQRLDSASSAIVANAAAQAEVNTNSQFLAMARMAERAVPGLRNVVEILCYAVFPLIVLLMVAVGSSAGTFLLNYVRALVWIQFMPCLYAVLNFVMTSVSRVSMSGIVSSSGVDGVSLQSLSDLSQRGISDIAIAGYLSVFIPAIAWGLVKAGEIGGTALFSAVSSAMGSSVSSASTALTSGNITQGGVSLDTSTANMTSANKYDVAPATRSGYSEATTALGTATYAGGSFVRFRANDSSLPLDSNLGTKLGNSLSSEAARRSEISRRDSEAATSAKSAALIERMGMVSSYASSDTRQGGSEIAESSRSSQAVGHMTQVAEAVNKRLGLDASSSVGKAVVGEASLSGGIGVGGAGKGALSRILSAGAGLGTKAMDNLSKEQKLQAAVAFARDELQNRNVSAETALGEDFKTSNAYQWAKSNRSESVKGEEAALTRAESLTRSSEVARAQSLTMANQAQLVRENWATMAVPLGNYVADQLNRNGQLQAFLTLSSVDPDRAADMAAEYVQRWLPANEALSRPTTNLESLTDRSPSLAGRTLESPGFRVSTESNVESTHQRNANRVRSHGPRVENVVDDVTQLVVAHHEDSAVRLADDGGKVRSQFDSARADSLNAVKRQNQVPGLKGPAKEDVEPGSGADRMDKMHQEFSTRDRTE